MEPRSQPLQMHGQNNQQQAQPPENLKDTLFNMSNISTIQQESGPSQLYSDPQLNALSELDIPMDDQKFVSLIKRLILVDELELKNNQELSCLQTISYKIIQRVVDNFYLQDILQRVVNSMAYTIQKSLQQDKKKLHLFKPRLFSPQNNMQSKINENGSLLDVPANQLNESSGPGELQNISSFSGQRMFLAPPSSLLNANFEK